MPDHAMFENKRAGRLAASRALLPTLLEEYMHVYLRASEVFVSPSINERTAILWHGDQLSRKAGFTMVSLNRRVGCSKTMSCVRRAHYLHMVRYDGRVGSVHQKREQQLKISVAHTKRANHMYVMYVKQRRSPKCASSAAPRATIWALLLGKDCLSTLCLGPVLSHSF